MRLTVLGERFIANAAILFSSVSALLLSCAQPEEPLTVIAGKGLSVPDGIIYLTTMERKALVIDSAVIHRGNFEFRFEKESEPFRACLLFKDSLEQYVAVHFAGNASEGDSDDDSVEYFMVERGSTFIEGIGQEAPDGFCATVTNPTENKLLFDPGYELLGFVDRQDSFMYSASVEAVKADVSKYPNSTLLFERIYHYRSDFKKEDLVEILGLSAPEISESPHLFNLNNYTKGLYDSYDPLKAVPLLSSKGGYDGSYDQRDELNMLVFSCTYIHPSELLLFYLEKRQNEFSRAGLYVADLDLTEIESFYEGKLEKIGGRKWATLHATKEKRNVMMNRYHIEAFPSIIFTNKQGVEVKRIIGYGEDTIDRCKEFVEEYFLANNTNQTPL